MKSLREKNCWQQDIQKREYMAAAGLLVAKVTLIDAAVWKETGNFFSSLIGSRLLLAAVLLILTTKFKKVHPVVWLAAAAVVGVVFHFGR